MNLSTSLNVKDCTCGQCFLFSWLLEGMQLFAVSILGIANFEPYVSWLYFISSWKHDMMAWLSKFLVLFGSVYKKKVVPPFGTLTLSLGINLEEEALSWVITKNKGRTRYPRFPSKRGLKRVNVHSLTSILLIETLFPRSEL